MDRIRYALHEAAHAVVAACVLREQFGYFVKAPWVQPDDPGWSPRSGDRLPGFSGWYRRDPQDVEDREEHLANGMVLAAGGVAGDVFGYPRGDAGDKFNAVKRHGLTEEDWLDCRRKALPIVLAQQERIERLATRILTCDWPKEAMRKLRGA